jgi:PAP2 superfamily
MRRISLQSILLLSSVILVLSFIALLVNSLWYHFPGNNYFPENGILCALFVTLLHLGMRLCFVKNSKACLISKELFYFFGIMSLIALATNTIQLTPFFPIDRQIVALETTIQINMSAILVWTNAHPLFKNLLVIIYDSLPYQMSALPLLVIMTCRTHLLREYYFFLLYTTLLGFGFYYFFPTTAPASMINSPLFSIDQLATGLKFQQIHHYLNPTTSAGGLIALPSFHVIWAVLCVNLLKEWPIPCIALGIMNSFLILSCVLLGWHYVSDVIGSIVVLLMSHYTLQVIVGAAQDNKNYITA